MGTVEMAPGKTVHGVLHLLDPGQFKKLNQMENGYDPTEVCCCSSHVPGSVGWHESILDHGWTLHLIVIVICKRTQCSLCRNRNLMRSTVDMFHGSTAHW